MSDIQRVLSRAPIMAAIGTALFCCASAASAVEPAFTYSKDQVFVDGPIPDWQVGGGTLVYSGNGLNGTTPTDAWNWVANPLSPTGQLAHQTQLLNGVHQQYYYYANLGESDSGDWYEPEVLVVPGGDDYGASYTTSFYTYVYLDPAAPPISFAINWDVALLAQAATWAHGVYWGASAYAGDSPAYHYMGPMPAAGGWVKLEVPLAALDLEANDYFDVLGMAFTLVNGRATFGGSGVTYSELVQPEPVPFYQYVLPQGQWDLFYTSNFAELGAGKDGYQFQGPVCSIETNPSIAAVELDRWYQPATGHHCYSTNVDGDPLDDDQAHPFSQDPWNFEGIAGFLYTSQIPGTVPFYRFLNSYVPIHAYSTASSLGAGWTLQCLEGYVFPALVGSG